MSSVLRRVALVTGGSQGIGEAIARRLARDGYNVSICDLNKSSGNKLAKELDASFICTDVTDPDDVQAAVHEVVRCHGSLDALVQCAGIVGSQVPCHKYEVAEWKKVLDVNLNGTFYGLKFALSQMVQQPTGGSIVNMSSTAGFRGFVNLSPYAASKFAVRGMTQLAAAEYANKNIRVNCIAPTATETLMIQQYIETHPHPETAKQMITAANALPGLPQPSDVAAATAFLLSDEARYVTGHTLPVDAGALIRVANQREMHGAE